MTSTACLHFSVYIIGDHTGKKKPFLARSVARCRVENATSGDTTTGIGLGNLDLVIVSMLRSTVGATIRLFAIV